MGVAAILIAQGKAAGTGAVILNLLLSLRMFLRNSKKEEF